MANGTDAPTDRSNDEVMKGRPSAQSRTILNVNLNDNARSDMHYGDRFVGGNGSGRGSDGVRGRNGRRPGDPWGMREYTDKMREEAHQRNLQRQDEWRQSVQDRIKGLRDKRQARIAERQQYQQKVNDEVNGGNFTNLTSISADNWKALGQRNGQIREEYEKNKDGSLVRNSDNTYKMKSYQNEGSAFDTTKGADTIAALEKWWAEDGVSTSRDKIPQGVFDKNGKLVTEGLTTDQVGALLKIKELSDAKLAPIRQKIALNDAQNRANDVEYLETHGVKVWDTKNGKRILNDEQVKQMARQARLDNAASALGTIMSDHLVPAMDAGNASKVDSITSRLDPALVKTMRDLGMRADQFGDEDGVINYNKSLSEIQKERDANRKNNQPKTTGDKQKDKASPRAATPPAPEAPAATAPAAPEAPAASAAQETLSDEALADLLNPMAKYNKAYSEALASAPRATPKKTEAKAEAKKDPIAWLPASEREKLTLKAIMGDAYVDPNRKPALEAADNRPRIQAANGRTVPVAGGREALREALGLGGRGGQGDESQFLADAAETALTSAAFGVPLEAGATAHAQRVAKARATARKAARAEGAKRAQARRLAEAGRDQAKVPQSRKAAVRRNAKDIAERLHRDVKIENNESLIPKYKARQMRESGKSAQKAPAKKRRHN